MTGRRRGGRPWKELPKDESDEVKALAEFLRAQVEGSGKTLAVLAGEINLSKSQISERLGGRIPEERFVVALVTATNREPMLRRHRLDEARRLRQAALHPAPPKTAVPTSHALELARARAEQVEVYDRLTRSLEARNQLHEAAGNSAKLVMVLLTMISKLEGRITGLTSECDQLRAAHTDSGALQRTQLELARAREQEQRAQQELARAREKQQQAEELAARVQAQVDQLKEELDRLRSRPGANTGLASTKAPDQLFHEPVTTADAVGDDIDRALDRASAINDQDDQVLRRITDDLGSPSPADQEHQAPRRIVGDVHQETPTRRVVRDNPPDNPSTGTFTRDNLPSLLSAAVQKAADGEYGEAVQMSLPLVQHCVRLLGPEHPTTLSAKRNLAFFLPRVGHIDTAIDMLAELLPVHQRVLGPSHPDTVCTWQTLAYWHGREGDTTRAAQLLAQLLPVMEGAYGAEDPETLMTRHNLASWRGEAGDAAGAEQAFAELLPLQEQAQGPEHPDTLTARHNLAHWRGMAGDAAGAAEAYTELLPVQKRVLGPDHFSTLATHHELGRWLGEAGDPATAVTVLAEVLTIRQQAKGPEDSETLIARLNLANWRGRAGDVAGAVRELAELLPVQERVLGSDHLATRATGRLLTQWQQMNQKPKDGFGEESNGAAPVP